MSSDVTVVAIIAAYNEEDIIEHVLTDLIDQGISIYFIDDRSTDGTVAIVERYLDRGVLGIERFGAEEANASAASFEWERILLRKAQLADELDADWFIHHDADEFRESPWAQLSLIDAIRRVDTLGYNAIDFISLDFWPVDNNFRPGADVRAAFPFYSLQAPHDRLQIRCWKKGGVPVDLASSGGHDVRFPGRNVFPLRFILRHYPVRSQTHGARKVFEERRNRFLDCERARGWHVQYDGLHKGESFIRDPSTLTRYDPDNLRLSLTLRHRGIEALETSLAQAQSLHEASLAQAQSVHEASLAQAQSTIEARGRELMELRRDLENQATALESTRMQLDATRAEAACLRHALESCAADAEGLHRSIAEAARRLDELHRSRSWRWTSPARAVYRMLTGTA
jgi:glycosyltransferase involved in cell wall biosynthesis